MKTLKKLSLTLAIATSLSGCAYSHQQGALNADVLIGFTEPTLVLASFKNPVDGKVTQQLVTSAGVFDTMFQGAVKVGASYTTYGMYKPNKTNNTNITSSQKTSTSTKTSSVVPSAGAAGTSPTINNYAPAASANGGTVSAGAGTTSVLAQPIISNNLYQDMQQDQSAQVNPTMSNSAISDSSATSQATDASVFAPQTNIANSSTNHVQPTFTNDNLVTVPATPIGEGTVQGGEGGNNGDGEDHNHDEHNDHNEHNDRGDN